MALTATAQRMRRSLPDYYDANEIVERVLQSWANEIDRADAYIDAIKRGMIPTTATDELGMLAVWEEILDLPIEPPDATVPQRQDAVRAALRRLDVTTAASVLEMLQAATGSSISVQRNTPGQLQDTVSIPFPDGSFAAAQIETLVTLVWSAHRQLFLSFSTGFILDASQLDQDTL